MLILRPGSAWPLAPPWTTPTGPPQKDPFAPLRDQKREDQHAAPSSPPLVFGLPFGRRFSAFDLLGCQIAMGSSEIRATILRCVSVCKRRWVCLIVRVKCNADGFSHVAQNDGARGAERRWCTDSANQEEEVMAGFRWPCPGHAGGPDPRRPFPTAHLRCASAVSPALVPLPGRRVRRTSCHLGIRLSGLKSHGPNAEVPPAGTRVACAIAVAV